MIRWLRRRLPHFVMLWDGWSLICYGYGWPTLAVRGSEQAWCFHIERVYIRPKYRGHTRQYMRQMLVRVFTWVDAMALTGGAITRIRDDRPSVVKVGQRWGGYVPYTTQGGFIWCYVDRTALFGSAVVPREPHRRRQAPHQSAHAVERRQGWEDAGSGSATAPAPTAPARS